MKFQKFIFVVVVMLASAFCKADQWETFQVIPNYNGFIRSVSFVSSSSVGCVGADCGIYRTSDAGLTWNNVLPDVAINDIKFWNAVGFATGSDTNGAGLIYKTTNGGLNWTCISGEFPYGTPFSKIYIRSYDMVVIVSNQGYEKKLYITTDGGITWASYFSTYEIGIVSGFISSDGQKSYACTQDNFYVKNGNQWLYRNNGQMTAYSNVATYSGKVYIGGQKMYNGMYRGAINSTTDDGLTWQTEILNDTDQGICNAISLIWNGYWMKGYAAASTFTNNSITGKIYKMTDGQTWSTIYERPDKEFLDVTVTWDYVYFVGRGGEIVRYSQTVTGIQGNINSSPVYKLQQNYPNPFNPTTNISYSLPNRTNVIIKVFNLVGQEITTLVNGVMDAGEHSVNFNAGNLSSGVYLYTFTANNKTSTRKMTLVK